MTRWILAALLVDVVMMIVALVIARWRLQHARRATQAAARQQSFGEIVKTVERLTREWNASDRIDMMIRINGRGKESA